MISLDWWLDVQRRAKAADAGQLNGNGTGNGAGLQPPEKEDAVSEDDDNLGDQPTLPADPSFLEIRTLGRIELKQGGVDFAPLMLGKPVIAFIWLYLLVRALTDPELKISRGSFADEFTPGLSVEKQLKRLRDRLDDMVHRDLPEELFSRLMVTRKHVRLDLSKVRIDIVRLKEVARACTTRDGILPRDLLNEAATILEETDGEFLPGWEQLEHGQTAAEGPQRSTSDRSESWRKRRGWISWAPWQRTTWPVRTCGGRFLCSSKRWGGNPTGRTSPGSSEPPTSRRASTRERQNSRGITPLTPDKPGIDTGATSRQGTAGAAHLHN
jgi:hypothetical protein